MENEAEEEVKKKAKKYEEIHIEMLSLWDAVITQFKEKLMKENSV